MFKLLLIHSTIPPSPHLTHTIPLFTLRRCIVKIYSGCLPAGPLTTGIIPSSKTHGSTIPLQTLTSASQPRDEHSEALLNEKQPSRRSSDSAASDFSLWSDTGDLAEQLADEEDPLRIKIRESADGPSEESKPLQRRQKHVHYTPHSHLEHKTTNPGISKEAIEIPNPPARQIGRTEKALAIIMTGDTRRAQTHGLTGQPLLYVPGSM